MVIPLVFSALLMLMIGFLLFPSSTLNAMNIGLPSGIRPKPAKYPFFQVVMIFALGFGLFYALGTSLHREGYPHLDMFQRGLSYLTAVLLGAIGTTACFWPIRFMRFFVRPLRGIPDSHVNPQVKVRIVIVSKIFGAIFLVGASYVIHIISLST